MLTRRQVGAVALGVLGASAVQTAGAAENCAATLDRSKVEKWLDGYRIAWEERDTAKAVALFTADARYHDQVFEPVMQGQEAIGQYWTKTVAGQADVKFVSMLWDVTDKTATAHWKADFKTVEGSHPVALDGVFRLTFVQSGDALACSELLEWWFVKA